MISELPGKQAAPAADSSSPEIGTLLQSPARHTIVELFEQQAQRTPGQCALVFEDQRLTYAELDRRASQLGCYLQGLGIGPETLVGLFVERSTEMIVGLLGILKAGAAYLPIDAGFPKERIAFMFADAGVKILLTQSGLLPRLPHGTTQAVCLDNLDWPSLDKPAAPSCPAQPDNLAYVIYTSGSTGRPKGVCIEHRNIVNYALGVAQRFGFTEGMNHATVSTIAADLGNTVIFPALITGGCLHVISQARAESQALLSEYFLREKIDVLKIVPSHLAALQTGNHPEQAMPRRRLILGGEASRLDWIERLRALAPECEIYNHYGPTETTVGVLTFAVSGPLPPTPTGALPLGRPLPNSQAYILDEHRVPVAVGEPGELYVGGRGVARGYLNRPDLTRERFVSDPFSKESGARLYRTGDRARLLPSGDVEFCGRADHQVKVHGYRVELGEIEGALREQGGVRDVVASAYADESGNNELVAYVVPKRADQPLWEAKAQYLLPDGSAVAHLNKNETAYIYNEIFVLQAYLRHGITIQDGDCIVDAGANIGLFTVFASRLARDLKIFSFEPNPSVYACLKANAEAWGSGVKCLPMGLAREDKSAEMTFFEGFSLLSGFYADEATEREVVKTYALNQESESGEGAQLAADLGKMLEERFHAKTQTAQLRALSGMIAEQGMERIDLLKVNVEKSELDVLQGIADADWPKIRQLVIEVDQKESLEPITTLLGQHGYEVLVEQDPLLRKTELCYVYAIRPSETGRLVGGQAPEAHVRSVRAVDSEILTQVGLRKFLKDRLPQYMVPSQFVLMEKFPLNTNGKIDRQALPRPSEKGAQPAREFVRPQTETEKALALIWSELLKIDSAGINDDFFELGGHSLVAIKAVSRIRDVFGVNITFQTLFEAPTIAGLSKVIAAAKNSKSVQQRIERRRMSGSVPLSFAQEQLWFLNCLAPKSPVYNMGDVIDFHGEYSAEAMRAAIKELVRRHEILRTEFSHGAGQPSQIVLPELNVPLADIDLSQRSEEEREKEWARIVTTEVRKPFDLGCAPLVRLAVVHLSSTEHRLLLVTHHILADEWSMEIVHQELEHLYAAYSTKRTPALAELPVQFADFARWQREWMKGEVLENQIAFWRKELAGAPKVLDLPADKPRPVSQSFRGAVEPFHVPAELLEKLKALGREQQATLFMVLGAAFLALLHRWTGQEDVVLGTPISGRTQSETQNLIGLFLNTVLLRAKFDERQKFTSLLQQVRDRALGAYAHSELPFERLVAELMTDRDPSRTPLFQVMFILHNADGVSYVSKVPGNQLLGTGTSKFDLTLILSEDKNCLYGLIEYSTDLFEPATIQRLARYYSRILDSCANPEKRVSELAMLPEDERQRLLVDWNNTAIEVSGKTLRVDQLIERQAERMPKQVALACGDEELTYGELDRRANQLARHLAASGVGPDVLVGIYLQRSIDMVVAMLGVLKSGGAYVPLDPAYPSARTALVLEDAKLGFVISAEHLRKALPQTTAKIISLDGDAKTLKAQDASGVARSAGENNLAYVIYTSGSTGKPKGVMVEHRNVVNFFAGMDQIIGVEPGTWLAVTSISFDISVLELLWTLTRGFKVVIHPEGNSDKIAGEIVGRFVTHLQLTPSLLRALVSDAESLRALGMLKKIFVGGEALPPALVSALRLSFSGELYNMYGPTETAIWSTVHRVQGQGVSIPIGKPIANTQVYVLDSRMQVAPQGALGQLWVGGEGVVRGYWNRPELTAERFVRDPFHEGGRLYRTGDVARFLPDGSLDYVGRADFQVKIRGFRIELGEIEAVLDQQPGVAQAVVVAREDRGGDKLLAAYFVPKASEKVKADALRVALEASLPNYMVPSHFIPLEKLPLTANGKIDRNALPPLTSQGAVRTERIVEEPVGEFEQVLAKSWAEALGLKHVSRQDNFFHVGGHSLAALKIAFKCRQEFQLEFPLQMFVQYPVLSEQAKRVEEMLLEQADAGELESLLAQFTKNK